MTSTAGAATADIEAIVRAREAEFVQALCTLIACESVNPAYEPEQRERRAQQQLASALGEWGISSELWEGSPSDLAPFAGREAAASHALTDRPNLLARLGRAAGGRTLILNSHIDVVPAGDGWSADAFTPWLHSGRIYGRGSADAKGSLMAMACALAVVRDVDPDLDGEVILHSVVDEEAGGAGTLACLGRGFVADAAIVGEPTDLAICPATRSSRRFLIEVDGRAAHPGEAFLGVNAAEKAMLLVAAVRERARKLDADRSHPLWAALPEQHVFNLNYINAGALGHGAVPDRCVVEMAAGGTAAESLETLQSEVEAAIGDAVAADEWLREHPPIVTWRDLLLHGSFTPSDHPFVEACAVAFERTVDAPPRVEALSAVTDMRHLAAAGIPTINFGPGRMRDAHGPDEFVLISDFLVAVSVLASAIVDWCGAT